MKKVLRKTKIVGTIGPASESPEMLEKLFNAGLNVTRINFSHGGYEENGEKIENIKNVRKKLNRPVALLLDTKGPEIRTGVLETGNEKVTIEEGQEFTFVNEDIIGNNTKTSISYKELYKDVSVGGKLLVDDKVQLKYGNTTIPLSEDVNKAIQSRQNVIAKDFNVELEPGNEHVEQFTAKKLLSNSGNSDKVFDNYVELVQIANDVGRFYGQMKDGKWQTDTPGNFNVNNDEETMKNLSESDDSYGTNGTSRQARLTITPPTGEDLFTAYIVITSVISGLVILAGAIVFIKKKF